MVVMMGRVPVVLIRTEGGRVIMWTVLYMN